MKYKSKLIYLILISSFIIIGQVSAQDEKIKEKVNFGYSTNPFAKTDKDKKETAENKLFTGNSDSENNRVIPVAEKTSTSNTVKKEYFQTVAQKTLEIARRANRASLLPTEVYKIGVGDVLLISMQNVPSQTAKYYTVLEDGTIDYPLAGELLPVLDLTTDEIEQNLREKIKLYENSEFTVKVREHISHRISVFGLVEIPGDKFLQREAIPLYVVRAEAIVKPNAKQVKIKRKDSTTEEFDLSISKNSDVLIFPGDIVEFIENEKSITPLEIAREFYFIGGEIKEGGQMEFHDGITLTQAILASGGLKNTDAKKIVIRRKDDKGFLKSENYNLKEIKKGKIADPLLQVGDTIEIGL